MPCSLDRTGVRITRRRESDLRAVRYWIVAGRLGIDGWHR
jgi:hypothetical protein